MHIIPVIDLMQGCVVHARRGQRQHYQPIQSALASSSKALDVVQGLLGIHPFDQLYIADVDAIRKHGQHRQLVADIRKRHPQIRIWLDAGIDSVDELERWQALDVDCIIASESLRSLDDYLALRERCTGSPILSLDFTEHGYQGPAALLENPALWPARIIAMTLAKVGSNAGPDQHKLAQIMGKSNRQIYAAGGVRNIDDIRILKRMGIQGVLVASALHAGNLTGAEIETLQRVIDYSAWKG